MERLDIYQLHVLSDIQSRFATTEILSRIANRTERAQETVFVANLPNAAFITYFEMEVNGKVIIGEIKEKEKAKQTYEAAKFRGETAGHIAQKLRESNKFEISVNIKEGEEAKFKLVYQELLQRVRGVYKHQINIQPGQVVPDLQVDVHIAESLPFRVLHVPKFAPKLDEKSNQQLLEYNKAASDVKKVVSEDGGIHKASIQWRPEREDQKRLGVMDGQLVVLYDLHREEDTGQLQVVDGYFIHYFAPSNLSAGNKNIIFCLDVSGSMSGSKIQQTKDAMKLILSQLRPEDQFNIIPFSNTHQSWMKSCLNANQKNIQKAQAHIQQLSAGGGTNIHGALMGGIKELQNIPRTEALDHVIILLTDGQHNNGNGGVTSRDIPAAIQTRIKDSGTPVKIYGLGFGSDADFSLLKDLGTRTGGLARRIYADADAAIQLQNFYEEISSPTLANLDIKYLDPNVDPESIVETTRGGTLYDGSEVIYCGRLRDPTDTPSIHTNITGRSSTGHFQRDTPIRNTPFLDLIPGMDLTPTPAKETCRKIPRCVGSIVERSWAYLTIKNLLEKADSETESELSAKYKKEALDLSLKYGFVTGVTSLVAVQPADADSSEAEQQQQLISDESVETSRGLEGFRSVMACSLSSGGTSHTAMGFRRSSPMASVLERGEKLDLLADKSYDSGVQSKMFYKSAAKCKKQRSLGGGVGSSLASFGSGITSKIGSLFAGSTTSSPSSDSTSQGHQSHRKIQKFNKSQRNEKDTSFLTNVTAEQVNAKFDEQHSDYDVKGTLIDLFGERNGPGDRKAAEAFLGSLEGKEQASNPNVRKLLDHFNHGQSGESIVSGWIASCLSIGSFSAPEIDEIYSSVLSHYGQEFENKGLKFQILENPNLHLSLNEEKEHKHLALETSSFLDAVEFIFKVTKIYPQIRVSAGLQKFLKFLFEIKMSECLKSDEELVKAADKIFKAARMTEFR